MPTRIPALLFLVALPALAEEPAGVEGVIDEARARCAAFEGGTLTVTDTAIVATDLTGDGTRDAVVDGRGLRCSSAVSLFCGGTGGCEIALVAEGTVTPLLAKGWRVVDWAGDRIVLLQVHGSECGGTNLRRCYEALVWSEGAFRTVNESRAGPD